MSRTSLPKLPRLLAYSMVMSPLDGTVAPQLPMCTSNCRIEPAGTPKASAISSVWPADALSAFRPQKAPAVPEEKPVSALSSNVFSKAVCAAAGVV